MKGNLVILSNSLKMHEPKILLPKESIMDVHKDFAVSCSLLLEINRMPNNRRVENYIYSPYSRALKNDAIEMSLITFRDVHNILPSNKKQITNNVTALYTHAKKL